MNEELLNEIIKSAFLRVKNAYTSHKEINDADNNTKEDLKTLLVFPQYGQHSSNAGKIRVSEQELRFAFVEAFEEFTKGKGLFYSVETPTESKYLFTDNNSEKVVPRITDKEPGIGKSGQFDLVIHDEKIQRICIIEFKAGFVSKTAFKEVLLKLANPEEDKNDVIARRCLIHMVEEECSDACKNNFDEAKEWIATKSCLSNTNRKEIFYVNFSLNEEIDDDYKIEDHRVRIE